MIDTLLALRGRPEVTAAVARHGIDGGYLLVTLHRPALVDGPLLADALAALRSVAAGLPVVFPVHPRTRARLKALSGAAADGITLLPPLGYLEFLGLMEHAAAVLTDSGGIQEETTILGVPCFTLRATTERPATVSVGTNTVLGLDPARIAEIPRLLRERRDHEHGVPELWDGAAATRVVDAFVSFFRGEGQ
jgi:UDP-N-acetylglucosamine 2-epimerase (non-hydrolysing)